MKKLLSLLLVLCLCVPFISLTAKTEVKAADREYADEYYTEREGIYYVSPNGNDANDGKTLDKAWKTLSFAAFLMGNKQIHTVLVADGVYYEQNEIKPNGVKATKEKPAILKSINKWGAKIVSNSPYHGVFICNCEHFIFDGFVLDFDPTKNHHMGILSGTDGSGKVSNHITVRNCYITNAPCTGIQLNGSDNVVIENNYVYKNALTEDGANGSGISIYEPKKCPSNKSFEDNEYGIVIRNNVIWQNNCLYNTPGFPNQTDGNGIILDDYRWTQNGIPENIYDKHTLVENNLVFDNGGRGVHVFISDNITIKNNTIFKNGWTLMQYYPRGCGINLEQSNGNTVVNNLVVGGGFNNSTAINDKSDTPSVYKNNVVAGTININGQTSFADSSNVQMSVDEFDKIGFLNPSTDVVFLNFGLSADSPYIGAGAVDFAPADDITGAIRDKSDGVSVGCYEGGGEFSLIPRDFVRLLAANEPIISYTTPSNATGKVGNVNEAVYEYVSLAADAMVASAFVSRVDINCTKVKAVIGKTTGKVRVAIYKDNGGFMGIKVTESEAIDKIDEEGTYTFNLKKTVSVKKGETIWIAVMAEGGADTKVCAYNLGSGTGRVAFVNFGNGAPLSVSDLLPCNLLLSAYLEGEVVEKGEESGESAGVQESVQEEGKDENSQISGCSGSINADVIAVFASLLTISAVCVIIRKRKSNG